MGRQITVDPVNLMRAGAKLHIEGYGQQGAWLKVTIPDGRFIGSTFDDCLCFDCRSIDTSANGWMEEWLIDNDVQYAHG
ncbi:hypothetical protein [Pseudomonas capsici]|uniref:hypothetical protein n=1 Tax=Pseudomonas capsici TaxID=2810614 RepID=UPI0021F12452|nr:hypothetical protein [Pseudomonas capsici]MCV4343284.1 hypothetical protein [Pseudomonas capsici]